MLKDATLPVLPVEMAIVEACVEAQTSTQVESEKLKVESGGSHPASPAGRSVIGPVHNSSSGHSETHSTSSGQAPPKNPVADRSFASAQDDPTSLKLRGASKNINDGEKTVSGETPNTKHDIPDTANTVPVAVFQMTVDLWNQVIEEVKKENTTLSALLRDAKPLDVVGNKVKLGVKFPFHKEKISEAKNREYLEGVMGKILGQKCILSCEISDFRSKKKAEAASDDELQKAAEEIFA
jgi:hypothetical protein